MNHKNDRNKTGNGLKCCQSNDSLTSITADNNDTISNTFNKLMTNEKLQVFTGQQQKLNKTSFPKRQPVDVEFEDITYTATEINLRQFKLGK